VPVQVRAAGGETVVAEMMNISEQGMFVRPNASSVRDSLRVTVALGAGKPLVFRLRIAGAALPCQASGRVAWRSDLGIGVDFVEIDAPLRDFIERLGAAGEGAAALLATIEPHPVVEV
jgi:hypothetical protein